MTEKTLHASLDSLQKLRVKTNPVTAENGTASRSGASPAIPLAVCGIAAVGVGAFVLIKRKK